MTSLSPRAFFFSFAVLFSWPLVGTPAMAATPPVMVAPSWNLPAGTLTTSRVGHTSTLLTNGKVLFVGGSNGYELSTTELFDPATGLFTRTGDLHSPRLNHVATLLPNGFVLVAGGQAKGKALATAELYDPATGVWTVTGNLHTARAYPAITPLHDGTVLISGGSRNATPVANPEGVPAGSALVEAELYDPGTGIWTTTGSLHEGRYVQTSTLLPDGQVLVTGGIGVLDSSTPTAVSELYNPVTKSWSLTGSLQTASFGHAAVLLSNGQVLVGGGKSDGWNFLTRAELYDPATGLWSATGSLAIARGFFTASPLPNGLVFFAGGRGVAGSLAATEVYNVSSGTWSAGLPLTTARSGATANVLPSGQVLVAGGINGAVSTGILKTAELYDPSIPLRLSNGGLIEARIYHTATLLPDGKVLVAGGGSGTAGGTSVEIYDPVAKKSTLTGALNIARSGHTATLLPQGQVLVVGGYNDASSSAEIYNPATGSWTLTASPIKPHAGHAATLLPTGMVLVTGGTSATAELYDPLSNTWKLTGSMNRQRGTHAAVLLPNGKVLVIGGDLNPSQGQVTCELYDPASGMWTATGGVTVSYNSTAASLLPNGKVLMPASDNYFSHTALYDSVLGRWAAVSSMTYGRSNLTRTTLLLNGSVLTISGGRAEGRDTSEYYNPSTGLWKLGPVLRLSRSLFTATLLPSGDVLVMGGINPTAEDATSIERFTPGLNYSPSSQPQLDAIPFVSGYTPFDLTGAGFTGVADDASASNIPVVRLQSLANGQVVTLPLDPAKGFDAAYFASLPSERLVPGYVFATVFVNGIPSPTQICRYAPLPPQTVTFDAVPSKIFGTAPFALHAVASSGLPVVYGVISGPATLSGNIVTLTGAGEVVLQAGQAGDALHGVAFSQQTLTVAQASQTISFPAIATPQYEGSAITLAPATASSGLGVRIKLLSGPATLTGDSLVLTGPGTVVLQAKQSGNANYLPASVNQSLAVIARETQAITFPALGTARVTDAPVTLKGTSSSALPVTYSVTGPARVVGSSLVLTGAGGVVVTAHQAGNYKFAPAPEVVRSFKVISSQTISLPPFASQKVDGSVNLPAVASSGLPISYGISGPATLTGTRLDFHASGTVTVTANQVGNKYYEPAPEVVQTIEVTPGSQTITFPAPANQAFNGPAILLKGTSSAGLPITYTVGGPAVLTGNSLQLTGVGKVKVIAHQEGNANYLQAPDVAVTFRSLQASQTVTFPAVGDQTFPAAAITLKATASSGLPIEYVVASGPGVIEGDQLTFTGPGRVAIQAVQAGDANYLAAGAHIRVTVK